VGSWERMTGAVELRRRLEARRAAGWSSRRMAGELNAAGYRTPHGKLFTATKVRRLRARWGLGAPEGGRVRASGGPGAGVGRPDRGPPGRPAGAGPAPEPEAVG